MQKLISIWDRTSLHLRKPVYLVGLSAAILFVLSFFVETFFTLATAVLLFLAIAILFDIIALYRGRSIEAERGVPERMSNGDINRVRLKVRNNYAFKVDVEVIDELPLQFQIRNWTRRLQVNAGDEADISYELKPSERGEYEFGDINVYVDGPLGLISRRYRIPAHYNAKVYPSFIQMRRYQLIAAGSHIQESGLKRMRKLGHSMEFEQIKDYVVGDDYRTINWKATARRGDLMVNNFTDERSQQIYCVINKGRVMKMPFEGMTMLDYAINASLVISGVALQKQDKAGLICFSQNLDAFLPADRKPTQVNQILETLYKQQTNFKEPDLEKLFSAVRNRITHRSLLILFTNFESMESLERELPSLRRLAHYHLLMVVFFENTELKSLTERKASTIEDIYIKTIAEKYRYEKQLIARELHKNGIIAVLSSPENLTVNSLNKYLEVKNRSGI